MPHFWCGVRKFSNHRLIAVRLAVDHGIDRLGVDRRPINAEALAKGPHPQVILIELLTPGERAPGDQFVDVGITGVVADLFRLQSGPDRRRDDLARLRDHIPEANLLILLRDREMGMIATSESAERIPSLDRNLAVGFRREAQEDFAGHRCLYRCARDLCSAPPRSPRHSGV